MSGYDPTQPALFVDPPTAPTADDWRRQVLNLTERLGQHRHHLAHDGDCLDIDAARRDIQLAQRELRHFARVLAVVGEAIALTPTNQGEPDDHPE